MTTEIEQLDKLIADNTQYIQSHMAMIESELDGEVLKAFNESLTYLEKWLEDIGDYASLIIPVVCYKHAIKAAETTKQMILEGE